MDPTRAPDGQVTGARLAGMTCRPTRGEEPLPARDVDACLSALPGWSVEGATLHKRFPFDDYARILAFANAVGCMAIEQDHHPEIRITHASCIVRWSTHDVGGLSINDFICAARTDALC